MRRALPFTPALLAALVVAGCASLAELRPVQPAAVEAGHRLAQRSCSGCHAMTPARPSIDHRAPPFWTLAGRHTPDSLARAARTTPGHDPLAMPSVILTPSEAADVIAYIDALSKAPKSAWRDLDVSPCIATARC